MESAATCVDLLCCSQLAGSTFLATKCFFTTFKNMAHRFADIPVFKAASLVGNRRQAADLMRANLCDNDLIRVGIYHKVRVVGDHDDLAFGFGRDEQ